MLMPHDSKLINRVVTFFFCSFFIFATGSISGADQPKQPCSFRGTALVVDTSSHKLWLCQGDNLFRELSVAIGRGGTDKHLQGDNKTPLGEYGLGVPRPSEQFGLFIPVGYPTKTQRELGHTGGDIGIHGPPRGFKWLGPLTTWVDWTRGCIAVGSDEAISTVAQWVKQQKVERIVIQ